MQNLLDKNNIENAIKYFQLMGEETLSLKGKSIEFDGFNDFECYFDDNYRLWEMNKRHIYSLFGERLKIKIPLDSKELLSPGLVSNIKKEFLSEQRKHFNILVHMFLSVLEPQELIENKLARNITILNVALKKGWKVSKCISFLELDDKELEQQQNLYSILRQSFKVSGNLVLSIDPLDYITMSVSNSGWSSCHHPTSCNGLGGIAYMNDSSTIIAYVETADPISLYIYDADTNEEPTLTMPNKVWRQIVVLSPDNDYAVQLKGYPNDSIPFKNAVTDLMSAVLKENTGNEYCSEVSWMDDDNGDLIKRNEELLGHVFYCDYSTANMSKFTTIINKNIGSKEELDKLINKGEVRVPIIGEEVYCACGCGEVNYTDKFYKEDGYEDYAEW